MHAVSETVLPRLNSLWVGEKLGYLELLCLKSALSVGHEFTLFSYTPELLCVPDGVELRDATEIMPRQKLRRYSGNNSVALGANLWRYEMIKRGRGCWVDMDHIFLKPIIEESGYILGWEHEGWLNNAVLLAPPNSDLITDLVNFPTDNKCPPWLGPKSTLLFYLRRLLQGPITIEDMPWGTYSAGLLTYLVKKHGLQKAAKNPNVYYPIRWRDARELYGPAEAIQARLTSDTRTIHMWNSRLVGLFDKPPPMGSYIAAACERFGIDPSEHLRLAEG